VVCSVVVLVILVQAFLSALGLINPALIPSITLANAIGNSALTLIAGNNVEPLGAMGEIGTGVVAGASSKVLPNMPKTKSTLSSAVIPTVCLTARFRRNQ
jgi:hypothetical protein